MFGEADRGLLIAQLVTATVQIIALLSRRVAGWSLLEVTEH